MKSKLPWKERKENMKECIEFGIDTQTQNINNYCILWFFIFKITRVKDDTQWPNFFSKTSN